MASKKLVAPEMASIQVAGMTREAFLVRATIAGVATYGATMATPFISNTLAQSGGGDVDIVNYALTLEYLEAKFYEEGMKVSGLSSDEKDLIDEIAKNEKEHVDALKATAEKLGGKAVAEPTFDFGSAMDSKDAFLKTANTLEDAGVSAYNGAATKISSKDVLGAAGSIVQVEARHAALIRLARKKPPAPLAFDKPAEMDAILKKVKPFIKS